MCFILTIIIQCNEESLNQISPAYPCLAISPCPGMVTPRPGPWLTILSSLIRGTWPHLSCAQHAPVQHALLQLAGCACNIMAGPLHNVRRRDAALRRSSCVSELSLSLSCPVLKGLQLVKAHDRKLIIIIFSPGVAYTAEGLLVVSGIVQLGPSFKSKSKVWTKAEL